MATIFLTFVVGAILAVVFHALLRNSFFASLTTGITLVFFVRFLFDHHFPEIYSFDFWLFSGFIVAIGTGIAFLIGRIVNKRKVNAKDSGDAK